MSVTFTRRSVVLGAVALPLILPACAAAQGGGLTFLAVGDWGVEGEDKQRDVARQMARTADANRCRFVVSLGDNFYESGVETTEDKQWQTSFEDIYTADSLQVPWYPVLGNHDHYGNPDAQIAYSKKSRRWRMPDRYYQQTATTGDGRQVDMFFLDTEEIEDNYIIHHKGSDDDENARELTEAFNDVPQLVWLERQLAASTAHWKLVFGHHPVFSGGEHGDTDELVMSVEPLLRRHGVAAYFNGHDHDLQHIERNGVQYICSGAGARPREVSRVEGTKFCSERAGFVAVRLDERAMELQFIGDEGALLYSGTVPRRG